MEYKSDFHTKHSLPIVVICVSMVKKCYCELLIHQTGYGVMDQNAGWRTVHLLAMVVIVY